MAHMFESGFFNRGIPAWHSLGIVIDDPAVRVEEAIRLAGLDWAVQEVPLLDATGAAWKDYKGLARSTDGSQLAVVGSDYTILQNADAFAWFQPFLDEGRVSIESAGSLAGGRRVWVLCRVLKGDGTQESAEIADGDSVDSYLLLANSHDASLRVSVMFTPIRVVCQNTLTASLAGEGKIQIRHTKNLPVALELVRKGVRLAEESFRFTVAQYRQMAARDLGITGFRKYVQTVWQLPEEEDAEKLRAWGDLLAAFQVGRRGSQIDLDAAGTVWGGYNAVTQYVQHARGRTEDSRLRGAWWGPGAELRDRAFEIAAAMVA